MDRASHWTRHHPAEGKRQGTVAFFTGCVMNSMLGSVNRSSVRLLTAAGYDVLFRASRFVAALWPTMPVLRRNRKGDGARKTLRAFPSGRLDAIIINAAGCGAMLKEYPLLIDGAEEFLRQRSKTSPNFWHRLVFSNV